MDAVPALDAAQAIVSDRYPNAVAAFLTGNAMTEPRESISTLDIIIILRGGPAPFRETMHEYGWLAELYVHTPASIDYFSKLEAKGYRATTERMIVDGYIFLSVDGEAERIQTAAAKYLEGGPPQPSDDEINNRRSLLTDQLDDLQAASNQTELLYIVGQLVIGVSELALLSKRHWLATGKWLPRHLNVSDPKLSTRLVQATRSVMSEGEKEELEAIAREILDRVGGPLPEEHLAEDVTL
ncbi:MAG TPA: hypothetical protein VF307_07130 [Candidatus Nanopelagicaceae bacterium]